MDTRTTDEGVVMRRKMSLEEREMLKQRIKRMILVNQGLVTKKMLVERFYMAGYELIQQAAAELVGHPKLPDWKGWPTTQHVRRSEIDLKMVERQCERNKRRKLK